MNCKIFLHQPQNLSDIIHAISFAMLNYHAGGQHEELSMYAVRGFTTNKLNLSCVMCITSSNQKETEAEGRSGGHGESEMSIMTNFRSACKISSVVV